MSNYSEDTNSPANLEKEAGRFVVSDRPAYDPGSCLSTTMSEHTLLSSDEISFHVTSYRPTVRGVAGLSHAGVPAGIAGTFGHNLGVFRLLHRIRRLREGWNGSGSCAPTKEAANDIAAVAHVLDNLAKTPYCEIEDDGSIKLSWANKEQTRKLVLTFRGTGRVVGSLVTADGSPGDVWKLSTSSEQELCSRLDDETLDDILS